MLLEKKQKNVPVGGITNQLGCNKGQWWGVVGIVGEKMNTMSKSSGKSQGSQGGKVERPGVDVMRNSFSSFCYL